MYMLICVIPKINIIIIIIIIVIIKSAFPQLATIRFAAKQVWFMGGRTRNIAFQLVFEQCYKHK